MCTYTSRNKIVANELSNLKLMTGTILVLGLYTFKDEEVTKNFKRGANLNLSFCKPGRYLNKSIEDLFYLFDNPVYSYILFKILCIVIVI